MPIRRTVKNVIKNYTDAQVKVREATSNDPWGPSSTLMSEIADLTYNVVAFTEIMPMIWKRLNDHGKNWRHVYKALVLLDYIIKTGSEKVAQQCRENIFAIQTLKDFQYIEEGKDHGMSVREKAKALVNLLKDDERLRNERAKALKAKERFAQNSVGIGSSGTTVPAAHSPSGHREIVQADAAAAAAADLNPELEAARPSTAGEEELQLQLALAMSKEEADEDDKKRRTDNAKLEIALEESKKEQEVVYKTVQEENSLLDLRPNASNMGTSSSLQAISDPWGTSPAPAQGAPSSSDPWSSSQPALHTTSQPAASSDPWGAPVAAPAANSQPPAMGTDPWNSPPAPSQGSNGPTKSASSPAIRKDPWAPVSGGGATSKAASSPWQPQQSNGATSHAAAGGIDEEFDILGSRSKSPTAGGATGGGIDLLAGTSGDPWSMGGLGQSLPSTTAPLETADEQSNGDSRKDPKTFLGTHADLVNLDNLVSKPPESKNPFAMTLNQPAQNNPFGVAPPKGVPLNQMSNSTSMGFTQPVGVGQSLMPTPLAPSTGGGGAVMMAPPMGAQQQMYGQPPPAMMTGMGAAPYPMVPLQQQQQQATNPFL